MTWKAIDGGRLSLATATRPGERRSDRGWGARGDAAAGLAEEDTWGGGEVRNGRELLEKSLARRQSNWQGKNPPEVGSIGFEDHVAAETISAPSLLERSRSLSAL